MRWSSDVFRRFALLLGSVAVLPQLLSGQVPEGSIVGTVRVSRGNFPPSPVMVSLVSRGALVNSMYADNEGRFGFGQLLPNVYHLIIDEKEYLKVEETVMIDPTSPVRILSLTLIPREAEKKPPSSAVSGGNSHLTDSAEYTREIPKTARHEFERAVKAHREGKPDDAIRHYTKALELAPDFYAARNNLGSAFLGKSQFLEAQEEFEKVIQVNPTDAAAYFNLANLSLLTRQYGQAQDWVEQGLSKQPDSAFGHFLQGSLY